MLAKQLSLSTLIISLFFSLTLSKPQDLSPLLSFKASSDHSNSLSSWVNSSDPCSGSWLGVTCNPKTHRVTLLVLENLNLTGSTQPLNLLAHLRLLSLKHNHLTSSSLNLSSWPNLKQLYLSHNHFAGRFPAGISSLRRLRRLDLSHNYFSGAIPITELTRMPHLLTLRLEVNSFTGTLISVNSSSSTIWDFNVSSNNLHGKIPAWMSRFPANSFAGNENLCGKPLPYECSNQTAVSGSVQPRVYDRKTKRPSHQLMLLIIGIDAAAVLAAIALSTWCCYKRSSGTHMRKSGTKKKGSGGDGDREGEEMVVFEGPKVFDKVDDLLKSSAELLGKGSVGTTYKVVMDGSDAVVVVVKRVREWRRKRELDGWLREIGGLRHSNVVSLRAYYEATDELLLVYDFLSSGSLHSLLHGNRGPGRTPLDWTTRLKLASGSAQGLAFIHCYNKSKLFHGHLTSSNIIVDHLGNACISDFGLHQLLPTPSSSNSAYKAPQLMLNNTTTTNYSQRKFSQKWDVYSFGMILLEILTGKMTTGEAQTSLVNWVQQVVLEESRWEVFDFELLRYKEMEEEMVTLLQVALLCLAPLPRDRPKMSMVHKMIEEIRMKGVRECGSSSLLNDISSDSSPSLSESTHNFTTS